MSDDLTPVEQARAARWSVEWLTAQSVETGVPGVIALLHKAADRLDPPVSVESLRADLEDARAERDNAIYWRDHNADEADTAKAELARLRSTHTQAEAAWERCKRQPRVWDVYDHEPEGVQRVRDRDGDEWVSYDRRWCCTTGGAGGKRAWRSILNYNGPLTEVLDED